MHPAEKMRWWLVVRAWLSTLATAVGMAARQVRAHWLLAVALCAGFMVATTSLFALGAYKRVLRELGLAYVREQPPADILDLQLVALSRPVGRGDYDSLRAVIEGDVDRHLGEIRRGITRAGQTEQFFLGPDEAPIVIRPNTPKVTLFFLTDFQSHVTAAEGALPAVSSAPPEGDAPVEVAIGQGAAETMGVRVGDVFTLYPFATDLSQRVRARIVGLIRPNNLNEEYWLGHTEYFNVGVDQSGQAPVLSLYVPEETIFGAIARLFPSVPANYWWFVYVDIAKIQGHNYKSIRRAIDDLDTTVNRAAPRILVLTALSSTLDDFETKLFFGRVPVEVLAFLVAGLAVVFVGVVGNWYAERQGQHIALLRSRGASDVQLVGLLAMQGLLFAVIAIAAGPFVGAAAIGSLGNVSAFEPLSGGGWLWAGLPRSGYVMAGVGAMLGLAGLLVPTVMVVRKTLPGYLRERGRSVERGMVQRWYGDVWVMVAAGVLYWQLRERGTFVGETVFRGRYEDWLLIVAPVMLILAGGLLVVRAFPLVVRGVAVVGKRLMGVAPLLVVRRMERDPGMYGVLVVLVMLGAGLGVFAASFGSTLERSYQDRARFTSGADLRATGNPDDIADVLLMLRNNPDVDVQSTLVYRANVALEANIAGGDIALLAVEPAKLPQVLWFRRDFSEQPLQSLMFSINVPFGRGPERELPGEPQRIGLWAKADHPRNDLGLWIRVKDSTGFYITRFLGVLNKEGWQYLQAELPSPGIEGRVKYPLKFNSIYLMGDRYSAIGPTGRVLIDELTVTSSDSEAIAAETFDSADNLESIKIPAFLQDQVAIERNGYKGPALAFSWSTSISGFPRGVFQRDVDMPLPAVVSESFLGLPSVRPGQEVLVNVEGRAVPISIQDTFKLFPATDPRFERVVVVSLEKLQRYLLAVPGRGRAFPNELWATSPREQDRALFTAFIEKNPSLTLRLISREKMAASLQSDPLAAAGWSVLPYVAYGIALLLVGAALGMYVAHILGSRRLEHAILITQGFSRQQLFRMYFLEFSVLFVAASLLGAAWGIVVKSDVMRFIDVTELGRPVIPPFVGSIDWGGIAIIYGGLFILCVVFTLLTVSSLRRLETQRVLRVSE